MAKLKWERSPTMTVKEFTDKNILKYEEIYEELYAEKCNSDGVLDRYYERFNQRLIERVLDDMTNLYRDSID